MRQKKHLHFRRNVPLTLQRVTYLIYRVIVRRGARVLSEGARRRVVSAARRGASLRIQKQ
jgi:hypothetical protein